MSEPFFRIEMLPAAHGDALLVEYGDEHIHRFLIDGGPLSTYADLESRLGDLPEKGIELLVVTHVDTDHIEGVLRLLAPPTNRWLVKPKEIWFNGWRHLKEDNLGGREGEFMGALLEHRAKTIWNTSFAGNAVRVADDGPLEVKLRGGMVLTLLSPDANKLWELIDDWEESCKKWNMTPGRLEKALERFLEAGKFQPDTEETLGPDDLLPALLAELKKRDDSNANGSSIAFLAEFSGKSCLFLADAHVDVVCTSLRQLGYSEDDPLRVDAVKMSHHGSKKNLNKELFDLVDAEHFLVSTNGNIHGHPDQAAIDAVIAGARRKPTVWFNYRAKSTIGWEEDAAKPGAKYQVRYPENGAEGILISL